MQSLWAVKLFFFALFSSSGCFSCTTAIGSGNLRPKWHSWFLQPEEGEAERTLRRRRRRRRSLNLQGGGSACSSAQLRRVRWRWLDERLKNTNDHCNLERTLRTGGCSGRRGAGEGTHHAALRRLTPLKCWVPHLAKLGRTGPGDVVLVQNDGTTISKGSHNQDSKYHIAYLHCVGDKNHSKLPATIKKNVVGHRFWTAWCHALAQAHIRAGI